ncbi:MAG: histidine kinase [Clostridia bacterium]|nr:histidine kinase [Clostridia bacterium]
MKRKNIFKSYGTKLIVIFILINLICVIGIGGSVFVMLNNVTTDNYAAVVNDIAEQMSKDMSDKISELEKMTNLFVFDRYFHYSLLREYSGIDRQNILNDYILTKGNTAMVLTKLKVSMELYLNNNTIPEYYYTDKDETYKSSNRFEVFHADRIKDKPYCKELLNSNQYIMFSQVEDDIERNNISLIAKLIDFSGMRESGFLRIVVDMDELFGDSLPEQFHQSVNYKIISDSGAVVFRSENTDKEKVKYLKADKDISMNYLLTINVPSRNINSGMDSVLRNVLLIALVFFVITTVISLFLKKLLYENIRVINDGIKEFTKGNYDYVIEKRGDDEFAAISSALNTFAQCTKHLINDVYEVMIQKQDAQLQMLQAKINPHFMYNIFGIISQLASASKTDDIVKIADKTSKFYRCALSKENKFNTFGDEIEVLNSYFDIIDIQRPKAVKKIYKFEDDVLECLTPNFIVQPIVENAIKHAMIDGKITIEIIAEIKNDMFIISIKDNGVGMTEKQAESLFEFKTKSGGYGLYNISNRIRLRYSDPKYNIQCRSEYGKGTEIILSLPYETEFSDEEI